MGSNAEIQELNAQLREFVTTYNPNLEDELDGVLTWLNPNEPDSNHQLRPPSLRLKNGIKLVVNNEDVPPGLVHLLRQFVLLQTRIHFFSNFNSITSFKDIQRLEKYYEFPLKYINIFTPDEWFIEMNGFRHYLMSKNRIFGDNIKHRVRQLIMEDDFDMAWKIYTWLTETMGHQLVSLLLDILMDKIADFSKQNMMGKWAQRFLVMETFNTFITKYWSTFAQALQCPEDDHEMTTEIFHCFEKEFVKIRTSEIYEICVVEYPHSKPALLELRNVMKTSADYSKLMIEFLSKFESKLMNPSVTTTEILLSYIRTIKSFLTVDPAGRYLQSVTAYIKPYLRERRDTVVHLLYAMLELDESEIDDANVSLNMPVLTKLSKELKDPDFGIEDADSKSRKNKLMVTDSSPVFKVEKPLCEQVLNYFLQWTPEPSDVAHRKPNNTFVNKSLLDILLDIFDSKDVFISEFLSLFTKKLLGLKYYKLETKWIKILRLLKKKFGHTSFPQHQLQDTSNINNIDIMLRDVKTSYELISKMHEVAGLDDRVFPKFISYLFWNSALEAETSDFQLPGWLETEIEKYSEVYSQLKPGRRLHLYKDQGTVELDLEFKDGRKISCEVPLNKAAVISCFDQDTALKGLAVEQIVDNVKMEKALVTSILQFWCKKNAIYYDDRYNTYRVLEYYEPNSALSASTVISSKGNTNGGINPMDDQDNAGDKQQQKFIQSMSRIWPFIQGMLTNLGSMKPEKIHSFLKMAVPKDIGYTATVNQLESYLNVLVDEDKLVAVPNGSYKLVK